MELCHQSNAAALLVLVDHQSSPFSSNRLHGDSQLVVAVATPRSENLAGKTLRVDSDQGHALRKFSQDHGERAFDVPVGSLAIEAKELKRAPPGWQPGGRHVSERPGAPSSGRQLPPFAGAAMALAERGLAVIPCPSDDGKSPRGAIRGFHLWKQPPEPGTVLNADLNREIGTDQSRVLAESADTELNDTGSNLRADI